MLGAIHPGRGLRGLAIAATVAIVAGADRPEPGDDWTFRPTVVVRQGNSQGSGTIIASVDGETLILTAAHVIDGRGAVHVELHRYNLGLERSPRNGKWPRTVAAEVAASDAEADLAILRIRKMVALPYVARLAPEDLPPSRGTAVTSIGIEQGEKFVGWTTRILTVDRFTIEGSEVARTYLITVDPPDHGRSGGGLFLDNGDLVGVCIGRIEAKKKSRRTGIFAAPQSIRGLLRDHDLDLAVNSRRRPPITATRARPVP